MKNSIRAAGILSNKMPEAQQREIPDEVLKVLKTSEIGYLSVTSTRGELFSYPVAFYFAWLKLYFMTPISAAKLKFVRANPAVSFLVDNHLLTRGACGAMIQGRAKVFSIAKTVLNILSLGPKMVHFAKKYPGMFTFYARGKELPDERKLYRYRLIRIDPMKVLYWQGYKFGRYILENKKGDDPLSDFSDDVKMETFAHLLRSVDEELLAPKVEENEEWVESLDTATKRGEVSPDEKSVFNAYRNFLRVAVASNRIGPEVTEEEKKLLKKLRQEG